MTMTNAEWMIKNGYKFSNLFVRSLSNEERNKFVVRYNNEKIDYFELNECHISFNDSAYKKWLDMEHKEPILDDAEKNYLSAVIKPWGQIYFAELKQKSGALSPAQGAWIHRHREHFKTKVWVLYGPEDVEEFLRYVSREAARYEV